ncbi:FIG00388595: hypothetical protein [hydrothermal vent metagenome]|uniref:Endonuclease/exonuclease/phosphatase domain-containing protein n=1 Tax=hydrothermal vent metagenome TaxID=652676 RepID=A0A1W1EJ94_9ZZZZ
MRFWILLIIPMILVSQNLKVASYNIQNLFDLQLNGSEYPKYKPYKNGWNRGALNKKLNNISTVICDIDADIIGLQEIENINSLKLLKNRLKRVGCEYRYSAIANHQNSTVKTAILSRYKIIKHREIKVSHSKRQRSILEAHIDINDYPLVVFVNHWKSKYHGGKESKRVAYAKALSKRLEALKGEYILLGDFNSNYNEYKTIEKKFNDTDSKTGINHQLKTIKNDKLVDINTLKKYKNLHYNLWLDIPKFNRWSMNFYGKKGTPDSIIIPFNMLDNSNIEYKRGSFGVFKPQYLFTKRGYINRWEFKNHKHIGKGYSDHLPIYASFSINGNKNISIKSIENLYDIDELDDRVKLKDVKVLMKMGNSAIIKQSINGRGVYIYRVASNLKVGYSYDIVVDKITTYRGLKEITQISNIREKEKIDIDKYIKNANKLDINNLKQNDIYRDVIGVYRDKKLYINGGKPIDIFFKSDKPKSGEEIKIKYAHIGYYNRIQIVVYNKIKKGEYNGIL